MSKEAVLEGLKQMDPKNENHWTIHGEAKLETVKFFSGGFAVTREQLNEYAPGFNRESLAAYLAGQTTEAGNATTQEPGPVGAGAGTIDDVAKQPEVEDGLTNGEIDVETLATEVARANEAVLELKRIQEQTRKDLIAAEKARDELVDRLHVVKPPTTDQENIRNYLTSQRRVNASNRMSARRMLAEAGFDIDAVQRQAQPSPIDQNLRNRRRAR
jgi:hypothetical protein